MTRTRTPEDICAYCDEYSVREADPRQAEIGMGKCLARTDGKLTAHVGWDNGPCVSYRLDKPNLAKRREYVAKWQAKREAEKA